MRRPIITILLLLAISTQTYALDSTGLDYGTTVGNSTKNLLNDPSSVDNRLQKPLTTNVPLSTLDSSKSSNQSTFCGQGQVQNERVAIQVTVSETGSITIRTDTNGDGSLDSTTNYNATKICIDGYQVGVDLAAQWYAWQASGGAITAVAAGQLNGCMDPTANPATYVGGSVSQKWADSMGKPITNSSLSGYTVTYYSGTIMDCAGTTTTPTATKYYDNPYMMNDAAIVQSVVCSMSSTDPACAAYAGTRSAQTNVSGDSQTGGACTIERTISDTTTHSSDKICEANRIYYPNPYTTASPTCFKSSGDRWDYNQQIRFRCDQYGKELYLEAWAWWEGAPCGSNAADFANYPPPVQLTTKLTWGGSSPDTILGSLSVNKRESSDNITHVDTMTNNACYGTAHPLNVHLQHTCAAGNANCTYTITIENAPACAAITYTHTPPPDEVINDTCTTYSNNSTCSIQDEWWYDATNTRVQTIKSGTSINNQGQVYDATTPYSPLPITCKTFTQAGTVCKDWWKKDRVYKCESQYSKYQAYTDRATTVINTASDADQDNFTYQRSDYNKENTPKCVLEVKYVSGDIANCYTDGLNINCPNTYQYDTVDRVCTKTPTCNPYTYDNTANRCQYTPTTPICEVGYTTYDLPTNTCRGDALCTGGSFYAPRNRCELAGNPSCSSPFYTYDTIATVCKLDPPPCPSNYHFDSSTNRCEPDPVLCPSPGVFNGPPQSNCVTTADCGTDTYDPVTKTCAHTAGKICQAGYSPDTGNNVCYITNGDCSAYGTWNPSLGKCTGDKEYICPALFDLQTDHTCTQDPTCALHNSKTVTYAGGCFAPKENTCNTPYTLNGAICEAVPLCPGALGTYVQATNRCEINVADRYSCDVNNADYTSLSSCTANCINTQDCNWPFTGGAGGLNSCSAGTYNVCGAGPSINIGGYGSITLAPGASASGCATIEWQLYPSVVWQGIGSGIQIRYNGGPVLGTISISGLGTISGSGNVDNGEFCWDSGSMQIASSPISGSSDLKFTSYGDTFPGMFDFGHIYSSLSAVCPIDNLITCTGTPKRCTKAGTCTQNPDCPAGYTPDGMKCVSPASCPTGETINTATGKCEKPPVLQCLTPYAPIDATTCQATPLCSSSATVIADKCTLNAAYDCKAPSVWNGSLCTADAQCPLGGTVNTTRKRCETQFIPDCVTPYLADATQTKCTRPVDCPVGTFDTSVEKCILAFTRPTPECPDAGNFDSAHHWCQINANICPATMFYDSANLKCWMQAHCPGHGAIDNVLHLCSYVAPKCDTNWLYDIGTNKCYHDPLCPKGSMNYTKDRCEAAATCSKTFYPEMDCTYMGTNKTNLQCKSNDPLPDCSVALKCPMGGTLSGSLCTAPATFSCTNPYILNGSDCTTPVPCPESDTGAITVDYATQKCKTPFGPRCPTGYTLVSGICQSPIPCDPGTYDPANNWCVFTPPVQYKCSADNQLYADQATCLMGCRGQVVGGGDIDVCGGNPWVPGPSYTVNGSGNNFSIGPVGFTLQGFTATGSTSSMYSGQYYGGYMTIGPRSGAPNILDVRWGNGTTGSIVLTGAYATGSLAIDYGAYCWDLCGGPHFTTVAGNTCIHSWEDSCEGYCNPCESATMCFHIDAGSCPQYAACPAGWTSATPDCHVTPPCTNGGTSDPATGKCLVAPFNGCPAGYGIVGSECVAPANCPVPGSLNQTLNACRADPAITCPTTDYTPDSMGVCNAAAFCPTGGRPTGGTEFSRRVYQKCIDPTQCEIKCSVQVNDTTYAEGYRTEIRNCTQTGLGNTYTCDFSGGTIQKDCGCITPTWNQSVTAGNCFTYLRATNSSGVTYIRKCKYDSQYAKAWCDAHPTDCPSGVDPIVCYFSFGDTVGPRTEICCEPSCTVTKAVTPGSDSVVHKEYTVKNCVPYSSTPDTYTCPIAADEAMVPGQDCGCSDHFGMTAGILSGIVESAKDRFCE